MVPFQNKMYFDNKPHLPHIQTLRCHAFVHVPKLVQTNINLEVMNSSVLIEFNEQTDDY
jgi:hypothetical protein